MDKSSSRTSPVRQASTVSSPATASTQASASRFTKPNRKASSFSRVKSSVKLEIDVSPQESEQATKSDARLIGEIKKSVDSVIHELDMSRMKSLSPRKTPLSARHTPSSLYANQPQQETPKRSNPYIQAQNGNNPYGSPYSSRQTPGRNDKYFSPPPGGYKDRRPGSAVRVEDGQDGYYDQGEGPVQNDNNFYTFNDHEEGGPMTRNSAGINDPRSYYSKVNMPLSARGSLPDQGQRYRYQASPFMETPKRSQGPGGQGFFQRPNEIHQQPMIQGAGGYEGGYPRSTRDINGMTGPEGQGYEDRYYMGSPNHARLGRIVQSHGVHGNNQVQHPGYYMQPVYHHNMMPGPVRAQHGLGQGPYLVQGGQQDGLRHGGYGQQQAPYSMQYQPRSMENAGSMVDQPYNAPYPDVPYEEGLQYRVNQGVYPQQGVRAGVPKIYTHTLEVPQNQSQPRMFADRSIYQEKEKSAPGSKGYFIDIPKQTASRNSVGSLVVDGKEGIHNSYLSQHLQHKSSRKASEEQQQKVARHKESIGTLQDVDLTKVEDSQQLKSYIAIKDSQIMSLAHLLEGLEKHFEVLQELREKGNAVLEDAAVTLREGLSQIIQNQ